MFRIIRVWKELISRCSYTHDNRFAAEREVSFGGRKNVLLLLVSLLAKQKIIVLKLFLQFTFIKLITRSISVFMHYSFGKE